MRRAGFLLKVKMEWPKRRSMPGGRTLWLPTLKGWAVPTPTRTCWS
jgi:hypothetical protein